MSLTVFFKLLTGKLGGTGFFAYLAIRNANKSRVELEKARQEASAALISQLPDGAMFRESTADGCREIWMPPHQDPPVIFLPAASMDPASGRPAPQAVAAQNPRAIGGESERKPDSAPGGSCGTRADHGDT